RFGIASAFPSITINLEGCNELRTGAATPGPLACQPQSTPRVGSLYELKLLAQTEGRKLVVLGQMFAAPSQGIPSIRGNAALRSLHDPADMLVSGEVRQATDDEGASGFGERCALGKRRSRSND